MAGKGKTVPLGIGSCTLNQKGPVSRSSCSSIYDKIFIHLQSKNTLDPDFSVQKINMFDFYSFKFLQLPHIYAVEPEEVFGGEIIAKYNKDGVGGLKFFALCKHGPASKKHKAELVVHEFHKPLDKVGNRQLPSHYMTCDFRNHVAENSSSTSRVDSQRLPSYGLPCDSRNHVAENTIQGVDCEQVAAHTTTSKFVNHVAENMYLQSMKHNCYQVTFWLLILEIMLQKIFLQSYCFTSDNRKSCCRKYACKEESQLLPSHNISLHTRSHVAENTFNQLFLGSERLCFQNKHNCGRLWHLHNLFSRITTLSRPHTL